MRPPYYDTWPEYLRETLISATGWAIGAILIILFWGGISAVVALGVLGVIAAFH